MYVIEFLSFLFVFVIGTLLLAVIILFIADITQKKDAIRRNYPVLGHFLPVFVKLGEFFRHYFFAFDREEMPFNRAERNWVHNAAANADMMLAFGSTKSLTPVGTTIFVSCPFPTLERDSSPTQPMIIGPYCKYPYLAKSLFNISAMSYGSISKPAIIALSNGARMAECWLNTGEGGLAPYHLEGNADLVFQIGSAKYGVRDAFGVLSEEKLKAVADYEQVKMFEIKLSQGAKPGKGGILPGEKVTPEVAAIRGIPVGQDSISPNRHLDIDSVPEILDAVERVRRITNKPVGIKFVVGAYGWLEQMFAEIHQRGIESAPDYISVDSGDGGTGAAPMALLDNVGLPIEQSLPMVADRLIKYNLKRRIRLIAAGKLITPAEVAWALCVGADFIVSARGFMFALGCIQALRCQKNTCPTGITTHKPHLQKGLNPKDKAVKVANYARNMMHEVETIAHACGVHEPREFKRFHVRIVQANGDAVPLDELHPEPAVLDEYQTKNSGFH
ncbi:MAG: FMN-binding glutamate synthase family protein [Gammaproteobacteria bacterium]